MIVLTLPYPISCLEFDGARNGAGYGCVRHEGKTVRAHRLAYCQAKGLRLADIAGLEVRHTCDNPACVNPHHLELGTHTDNMRDMRERGRNRQPKGEANGRAQLTDDRIREIRLALAAGRTQRQVADAFRIPSSTVCRINTRKLWGHVT